VSREITPRDQDRSLEMCNLNRCINPGNLGYFSIYTIAAALTCSTYDA
jgi:hypothetical protein